MELGLFIDVPGVTDYKNVLSRPATTEDRKLLDEICRALNQSKALVTGAEAKVLVLGAKNKDAA